MYSDIDLSPERFVWISSFTLQMILETPFNSEVSSLSLQPAPLIYGDNSEVSASLYNQFFDLQPTPPFYEDIPIIGNYEDIDILASEASASLYDQSSVLQTTPPFHKNIPIIGDYEENDMLVPASEELGFRHDPSLKEGVPDLGDSPTLQPAPFGEDRHAMDGGTEEEDNPNMQPATLIHKQAFEMDGARKVLYKACQHCRRKKIRVCCPNITFLLQL
jgi:hypothetical protein